MEAKTVKYGLIPFAVVAAAVIGIEAAVRSSFHDPLTATAAARVFQAVAIIGAAGIFGPGAYLPGIMPVQIRSGLIRGVLWAAAFGCVSATCGAALYLAGHDPLAMISVRLPAETGRLLGFLVVAGVVGPFAEELIFRGVVFGALRRWGWIAAVGGSTLAFAWAHHTETLPVIQILGGLIFAVSYEMEKNLLVPVVIHIAGNLALFAVGLIP